MPSWKKVIVSGSDASLNSLNVINGVTGSLFGTASWANNVVSASYALNATSASYALTATSASFAPTATNVFLQGGNSFGTTALLGTNDVQNLQFETSGSVRMTISGSNGNVGIGTTSPMQKLHVSGGNALIEGNIYFGNSSHYLATDNATYAMLSSNRDLQLARSGNPALTINASGNVGIGTTSPSYLLDVTNNTRISGSILLGSNTLETTVTGLYVLTNGNNASVSTYYYDSILSLKAGVSGGAFSNRWSQIQLRDGNGGTGYINFFTSGSFSRMYIDQVGNIGIATTTASLARLQVQGNVSASSYTGSLFGTSSFAISASWAPGGASLSGGSTNYVARWASSTTLTTGSVFDNGTNVGIGTITPGNKLDVWGGNVRFVASASSDALVRIIAANYATEYDARLFLGENDTNGMTFEYDGANNIGFIGMNSSTDPTGSYSQRIRMSRDGSEVVFPAGSVGIGTTSANEKLHVAGNINAYAAGGIDAGLFASTAAGSTTIALRSNGITHFNGGNVGIGTTSPSYKLEVVGGTINSQIARFITADYSAHSIGLGVEGAGSNWGVSIFQDDVRRFTIEENGGILVGSSYQSSNAPTNGAAIQGSVGIGTTTPTSQLHVAGDFQLLNAYYNSYSSSVSGTTTLATIPTSSYNGVFFDFVAFSGSNQRAGTLIGNWRSGTVQYTEYSTPDIGSTAAAVTMSVALSGANALVQSVSAPGWAIKATYRTV